MFSTTQELNARPARTMPLLDFILKTPYRRVASIALSVVGLDQLTKWIVVRSLPSAVHEKIVISGFFKLVHWENTGAAWSLFRDNNALLAGVALVALVILFLTRHHFDIHTLGGQISLGLIFGGILGNQSQ